MERGTKKISLLFYFTEWNSRNSNIPFFFKKRCSGCVLVQVSVPSKAELTHDEGWTLKPQTTRLRIFIHMGNDLLLTFSMYGKRTELLHHIDIWPRQNCYETVQWYWTLDLTYFHKVDSDTAIRFNPCSESNQWILKNAASHFIFWKEKKKSNNNNDQKLPYCCICNGSNPLLKHWFLPWCGPGFFYY